MNIRPILISDDTSTGIAIIAVNDEGENSIMIIPGANSLCDNDYFTAHQSELNDADYVIAQLETPIDDVYNLLVAAKEAKKVTILNPAPAPDTIPDLVLSHIDFLTPNETELAKARGGAASGHIPAFHPLPDRNSRPFLFQAAGEWYISHRLQLEFRTYRFQSVTV